MEKLFIDVGSTYFKIYSNGDSKQFFRDFDKNIYDDLLAKAGNIIKNYSPENIFICSSANGGLSTLIIGISKSFSIKFATNIAFNSGINIIDTLLFKDIDSSLPPRSLIDVVIIAGAIDGVKDSFNQKLFDYLEGFEYSNIVYVGSQDEREYLSKNIENLKILDNIITNRLKINETSLKNYLTNLYQADIMGKEDIKELYKITANQIFPTPYIVNQALPFIHQSFDVIDPFIVIDIGGATTDIHYAKDLINHNLVVEGGYDRLVFKKLGVYKSRESLIFTAKSNEFVYELLNYLNVTENIFDEFSPKATEILMQLAIFLVLYKVSNQHNEYVELKLDNLKSIVFTGGVSKVLSDEKIEDIIHFFYKKILHFETTPKVVIDKEYKIWTYGVDKIQRGGK
jgi:hypothetical protein